MRFRLFVRNKHIHESITYKWTKRKKTSNQRMVVLNLKIISWYAHKQKDSKKVEKTEEKISTKNLFKIKRVKKDPEEKE